MEGYLGETWLESMKGTPYEDFGTANWAWEYVRMYGNIDGSHHKAWVIDQVARILLGTDVCVSVARWQNGLEEYRLTLSEPSDAYSEWRKDVEGDGYEWDEGIAP